MNATQAENLRILIRHMETKVTRALDMCRIFVESTDEWGCGTPACALGECTVIPELRAQGMDSWLGCARELDSGDPRGPVFGLSVVDSNRIFGEDHRNVWKRGDLTPQEWAVEARKVLCENGYSMDEAKPDDGFQRFLERASGNGEGLREYRAPIVFYSAVLDPKKW